jgi:hypothetical protein
VLEHTTRISYQLFNGRTIFAVLSEGKVVVEKGESFVQVELTEEYLGKNITIKVSKGPGVGVISR